MKTPVGTVSPKPFMRLKIDPPRSQARGECGLAYRQDRGTHPICFTFGVIIGGLRLGFRRRSDLREWHHDAVEPRSGPGRWAPGIGHQREGGN